MNGMKTRMLQGQSPIDRSIMKSKIIMALSASDTKDARAAAEFLQSALQKVRRHETSLHTVTFIAN